MKLTIFKPLTIKHFRTLFFAQVFSNIGNWLDMLTINVLISFYWGLELSANAATVVAMSLPYIFLGPIFSVWIDRYSRKNVLLFCTYLRILVIIGFYFAPNLWTILILIFFRSTLASMFEPARQGMLRILLPKELMAEASSLGQMVLNLTKILAPAIGGTLLIIYEPKTIFIIEGVAFIFAVLLILRLPANDNYVKKKDINEKQAFWFEFKEGFNFIKTKSTLKFAISIVSLSTFVIFLYDSFFAPLSEELGLDQLGYGLISSSLGIGSVLGALTTGSITKWKENPISFMSRGRMLSGCLLLVVGIGGFGFANGNLLFWMFVFTLIGGVGTALTIPFGYILQTETQEHVMGRVTAFSTATQAAASLTSPILGALIGKWFGLGSVFFISGFFLIMLGTLSFTISKRKKKQCNKPQKRVVDKGTKFNIENF